MMPLIPIAMALAQFAPMIAGWLGGSKAEDVATKVVGVAQAVTGQSAPDAALAALQADPNLALQFQKAVLEQQSQLAQIDAQLQQTKLGYEKDIYAAEAADRDSARRLAAQQPNDWVRPTVTVVLLIGCLAVVFLMLDGRAAQVMKDPTAAGTLGIVIGYLFNELKTALGFYFGMTKDASVQTQTITQFAVSPGSVTPAADPANSANVTTTR
ncbi:hypothetical protein [Burkholderia seminalis]|uniref:hypothetical protein n=1 Tax=Burkholderia seminalis TaxID=488731 RepID=UPI0021AB8152|nr:hypothetical protein [Burkholderia seminalis]